MSFADDYPKQFKTFFDAYITCALWSSADPETDESYEGCTVAPESLEALKEDCEDFLEVNYDLLFRHAFCDISGVLTRAGHDFWLTRNRHGAGFWDGDWGDFGTLLTERSQVYGSVDVGLGDDGLVHFS